MPYLSVKGDGVIQADPLYFKSMTFFPDVTLKGYQHRYLSLEVKFLTGMDPGGSLCKALGQIQIYHYLGFTYSNAIVLDTRKASENLQLSEIVKINNNQKLLLYS